MFGVEDRMQIHQAFPILGRFMIIIDRVDRSG
jgi:hypothetical protein